VLPIVMIKCFPGIRYETTVKMLLMRWCVVLLRMTME